MFFFRKSCVQDLGVFSVSILRKQMETFITSKNIKIFTCEKCNFKCSKRGDYNRHLATDKHRRKHMETENTSITSDDYMCDCGREYRNRTGLWKHRKKCTFLNPIENSPPPPPSNSDNSQTEMMKTFMKENREMVVNMVQTMITANKEMVVDLVPKLQPNVTKNTQNNKYNINLYLNEHCKNAINFTDFVERIEVSHDDLENNAQLGFVDGISKILRDNLSQLTLNERPIHCTDTKRETLYIKDDNQWQKDTVKEKINSAIQDVSRKSVSTLLEWKKDNPEYEDINSDFSNKCIKMQQGSLPGEKKDIFYQKITHSLAKENTLNKKVIEDMKKS